jgi:ABC-type Zn2+ transport system substrate-binding protein/surface adhesin
MADLGFADEESNFDNESVVGAPESVAGDHRPPKRSLTELDDEADQNDQEQDQEQEQDQDQEQETPAGSDDNDKEEDDEEEVSWLPAATTRSTARQLTRDFCCRSRKTKTARTGQGRRRCVVL